MKEAKSALTALLKAKVLAKGMSARKAVEGWSTFIESMWRYGCFLVPMRRDVMNVIVAVDARFISNTVCSVAVGGKGKLGRMKALQGLDAPRMERCVASQKFS